MEMDSGSPVQTHSHLQLKSIFQATPPLPPAPANRPGWNDYGWRWWWPAGQQGGGDRILRSVGTPGT